MVKEILRYFSRQKEEFQCGGCKVETIVTSYLNTASRKLTLPLFRCLEKGPGKGGPTGWLARPGG